MLKNGQITLVSLSPEDTEAIGAAVGERLKGGEVIELLSDLGGGKTTFTRGLVAGAGSKDHVSSPTFTISKEYAGGNVHIYHFDFYRLQEAGLVAEALAEGMDDPHAVTVVEWGDIVQDVLPASRIRITIAQRNETARDITIQFPEELSHIVRGIA